MYVTCCFSLMLLIAPIFNFCLFKYRAAWHGLVWVDLVWASLSLLDLNISLFSQLREVFSYYVFTCVLCPLFSLFSFWYPYNVNVSTHDVVPEVS